MDFDQEERLYYRFPINNPRLCYVTKGTTLVGAVQEISYGGLNVKVVAPPLKSAEPTEPLDPFKKENPYTQVELHFMGKSVRCLVEDRYSSPRGIGYQLVHEHTQVLLFLKDVIPFIRAGTVLAHLENAQLEEREPTLPKGLTADGSVAAELKITGYDSNSVPNINMTLQHDKVIYQFTRQDSQILTYHNVWPGGESGRLRVTNGIDNNILRNSLAVLVGYSEGKPESPFGKLTDTILNIYSSLVAFNGKSQKQKAG